MQENRQHTHRNVTQDIPCETLIEEEILASKKHPSPCIIQLKISLQYNHGSLQSHSHNQSIHVNSHESTHPMPCFQPSQMLPWLTYQALSHSILSLFSFFFSLITATTTLVVSYIVASPTKPPTSIT